MSGFIAVGTFLTSLFFNLILFILWIRIALRYLKVNRLNSLSRQIYSVTDPLIQPLYRLVRYKDHVRQQYDWPVFLVIIFIELIKISLLGVLTLQASMPFAWLLIYTVADLVIQPCTILFFAILIRVILSFTQPHWQHPFIDFLKLLTQPLLVIGRKIVPDISGFDFSPWIIMVIIKSITLFIQASLPLPLL